MPMFATVDNIESLFEFVRKDKKSEGSGTFTANSYPVRFVLFDNFRDCYQFVNRLSETSAKIIRISQWIDKECPDVIIGYSGLAERIEKTLEERSHDDVVIAPFSELARFYDNKKRLEFNSLISTIKAIQNDKHSFDIHRRVYIPLVGLEGKMAHFHNDSQSIMWYLKNSDRQQNYKLVLTKGTKYGVKRVDEKFTHVDNVLDWLNIWTEQNITQTIICSSSSIFANAANADPDNAFDFTVCENAYMFMTNGLGVKLNFLDYQDEDKEYWEMLAKEIDVDNFQFEKFFNSKFDIHELANYSVFLKTWFEFKNSYDRWLLSAYYRYKFCNKGYICQALDVCHGYTDLDFVESLATTIFDLDENESYIEERAEALKMAVSRKIVISSECEKLLAHKLEKIATDRLKGYHHAMKFMTSLTNGEKSLMIKWFGIGAIGICDLRDVYPDLFHYMEDLSCDLEQEWIHSYIDEYRSSKIANCYSNKIASFINEHNNSEVAFNKWYQAFSTTRTQLEGREDIEVYYWIDGLGIDWIPYVTDIIKAHKNDNFYLNEIIIAKALLPTKTSVNKESLEKIAKGVLPKKGDIDEKAHKTRPYPDYIIDDFYEVRHAIENVLAENPGRKIAIVSDHGISYLSQFCQGFNLPVVTSDHSGRIAIKNNGMLTADSKYIILKDKKTMCALRHESLCAKIGEGSGCHGGCTPEEVLVPIFIISNQETVKHWTAILEDTEVLTASPIVHFTIKGVKVGDKPTVTYNGKSYILKHINDAKYETPLLQLQQDIDDISIKIGTISEKFKIKIKAGVEEDDPFAF